MILLVLAVSVMSLACDLSEDDASPSSSPTESRSRVRNPVTSPVSTTPSTTSSTSPTTTEPTWGYKVAVIDGDAVTEDDIDVRRANFLLNAIAPRCNLTPGRVADLGTAGAKVLREEFGVEVKIREVLEVLNIATEGRSNIACADVVTAYVINRGS